MTSNTKAKVLCGIDLGTHSCQVAHITTSGKALPIQFPDGNTSPRSVVYFQDGDEPLVGQEAENLLLVDPQNGVRHWKRDMGSGKVLFTTTSGCEYRAEDIAKLFLTECKNAFENEVGQVCQAVVITVPANYTDSQKNQTIRAAQAAGFSHIDLIHEPTAAMFSRLGNSERETPDGMRIVVDCGGGTLDISVCEKLGNRYEIKATNGVPQLGGMDFTQALFNHSARAFRDAGGHDLQHDVETSADLWRRCEEGKIRLNRSEKITIPIISSEMKHQVTITKDEARDLWKSLVDQILKCIAKTLNEAGIDIEDVCELIPIGGGSQLFAIQEELAHFFKRPISNHADPIHAVATGAVLKGWEDHGEIVVDDATILPARGHMLRDITAHALGVKALDETGQERFTSILRKGVPLPSCFQKVFQLTNVEKATSDSPVSAMIEIYQGESDQDLSECLQLGNFELADLPNVVGRPHRIEIEMRIDKNGMLTATAHCTESGRNAELQIAYKKESHAA